MEEESKTLDDRPHPSSPKLSTIASLQTTTTTTSWQPPPLISLSDIVLSSPSQFSLSATTTSSERDLLRICPDLLPICLDLQCLKLAVTVVTPSLLADIQKQPFHGSASASAEVVIVGTWDISNPGTNECIFSGSHRTSEDDRKEAARRRSRQMATARDGGVPANTLTLKSVCV